LSVHLSTPSGSRSRLGGGKLTPFSSSNVFPFPTQFLCTARRSEPPALRLLPILFSLTLPDQSPHRFSLRMQTPASEFPEIRRFSLRVNPVEGYPGLPLSSLFVFLLAPPGRDPTQVYSLRRFCHEQLCGKPSLRVCGIAHLLLL